MRVLVTGSSGFIGSHIIPRLVEKGYDVFALERYVTGRYAKPKNVKTVFGDLREKAGGQGQDQAKGGHRHCP